MHLGNLSQIALPNMWLLVLIDLANKLYHIENYWFHFIPFVIQNCLVLLRNFVIDMFNKIQFNSLYINMWLSSVSIFEENKFYKIKKRNI